MYQVFFLSENFSVQPTRPSAFAVTLGSEVIFRRSSA